MPKPANALVVCNGEQPWVRAYRCPDCGATATVETLACRRCFSRKPQEAFQASTNGTLYTWSVVERSYPGVAVPFVSAIIDLDDGLVLKGNLRTDDAASLKMGAAVELVFDDANGAQDEGGEGYIGYHFELAEKANTTGERA
jgi:uncharacterized protein